LGGQQDFRGIKSHNLQCFTVEFIFQLLGSGEPLGNYKPKVDMIVSS
jgi:hypothetical protein